MLGLHLPVAKTQTVICPDIPLSVDALFPLSHMPALTRLDFSLSAMFPTSGPSLSFTNLHDLTLRSKSLSPISRLLTHSQLLAITNLTAIINNDPSRDDLSSFLAGASSSNAGPTIEGLRLTQSLPPYGSNLGRSAALPLGFEDFWPCTTFCNIRHIEVNTQCSVYLTNSQVLTLASAWPKLERLLINKGWGWRSEGGITPGGLLELLHTCRSLWQIALCLDTRGYTEVPPSHVPAGIGSTLRPALSIDVVDSAVEAEAISALATFFSGIAACSEGFSFRAWSGVPMTWAPSIADHIQRWHDVRGRVNNALGRRLQSGGLDASRHVTGSKGYGG